ncbi:hypothetical protein JCM11491_004221 [Sporobolomyces phaffii]
MQGATDWLEALHGLLDDSPDVRSLYWRTDHSFAIRVTSEVPFDQLRRLGIVRMESLVRKLEQFGFQRVGEERLFNEERDDFLVFEDYSGAFVPFDSSAVGFMRPLFRSPGGHDAPESPAGSVIDHGSQTTPTPPRTLGSRADIRRRLEEHRQCLAPLASSSRAPPGAEPYLSGLGIGTSLHDYRGDLFDSVSTTSPSSRTPALSRSTSSDCSLSPFPICPSQSSPWTPWINEFETTAFPTLTLLEDPVFVPLPAALPIGPKHASPLAHPPPTGRFLYPWSDVPPVLPEPPRPRADPSTAGSAGPASSDLSRHQASFEPPWFLPRPSVEFSHDGAVANATNLVSSENSACFEPMFHPSARLDAPIVARHWSYPLPTFDGRTTMFDTCPSTLGSRNFPSAETRRRGERRPGPEVDPALSSICESRPPVAGSGSAGAPSFRPPSPPPPPPDGGRRTVLRRPVAVRSSSRSAAAASDWFHPYRVTPAASSSRTIHSKRERPSPGSKSSSSSSWGGTVVTRLERLASSYYPSLTSSMHSMPRLPHHTDDPGPARSSRFGDEGGPSLAITTEASPTVNVPDRAHLGGAALYPSLLLPPWTPVVNDSTAGRRKLANASLDKILNLPPPPPPLGELVVVDRRRTPSNDTTTSSQLGRGTAGGPPDDEDENETEYLS